MQRPDKLLSYSRHAVFWEVLVVLEYFEELSVRELGHDNELAFGLKGVQHLDDVLVPQGTKDLDLLPERADVLLRLAMLYDELEGHDLTCVLASSFVNFAERTLAHELNDMVVLHISQHTHTQTQREREKKREIPLSLCLYPTHCLLVVMVCARFVGNDLAMRGKEERKEGRKEGLGRAL